MPSIALRVNNEVATGDVEGRTLLISFLRETLGLVGTPMGCDTSQCGACVVSVNGRSVKACTMLAVQAHGSEITTIEGLAGPDGELHPMQAMFKEHHALQCGFCTAGMIMSAIDLVKSNPEGLSEPEIRHGMEGNICRCTGYDNIIRAIVAALPLITSGSAQTWERADV